MKQIFFIILLIGYFLSIKSQYFYSTDTIRTIYLYFYDPDWDEILDQYQLQNSDARVLADMKYNGTLYDSVGIRFKGNSSYRPDRKKNPFNIKLDYKKDHDIGGIETLKLSNMFKDPSGIREVLAYEIAGNYLPSPEANFVFLYVNDTAYGLYSNIESINKDFLKKKFDSRNNSFFKCDPITITGEPEPPPPGCLPVSGIASSLNYLGDDTLCYKQHYEIKSDSEKDWITLVDMIDLLNNHVQVVEDNLNIDFALWMLAFNNIFVNLDSYNGSGHNYYLYEDDGDRFNPLLWDMNECFGGFVMGFDTAQLQNLDIMYNVPNNKRPLMKKLLQEISIRKKFMAHYRTIFNDFVKDGRYFNRAVELQDIIDPYVMLDSNFLYSYLEFKNSLDKPTQFNTGTIIGIKQLMEARKDFLSGHFEFNYTLPEIDSVNISFNEDFFDGNLNVKAYTSNSSDVWVAYKTAEFDKFSYIKMYDDGLHDDGANGDGIFGNNINSLKSNASVNYFIYAENLDAGKFLPERAESEFFTCNTPLGIITSGDLVINEIMASNFSTQMDEDGDYDDWIELYNNTDEDIELIGLYLSDNIENKAKWAFPDTLIPASDYIIIWADENGSEPGLHANFKLSKSGEMLYLCNHDTSVIDSVWFNGQTTDMSYSRIENGVGNFQITPATFHMKNSLEPLQKQVLRAKIENIKTFSINKHTIVIEQDIQTEHTVKIYNTSGLIVYHGIIKNTKEIITLSSDMTGLLIVQLISNKGILNYKVLMK